MHGAAQHRHLPQAILGVSVAKAEIDIGIVGSEDMGHIGVVAHDLDLGAEAIKRDLGAVIGDRAGSEVIDKRHRQARQNEACGHQSKQPAKQNAHRAPTIDRPTGSVTSGLL